MHYTGKIMWIFGKKVISPPLTMREIIEDHITNNDYNDYYHDDYYNHYNNR